MSLTRATAVLVAGLALLWFTGAAAAATSRLTSEPPVPLTAAVPARPAGGPAPPGPPDAGPPRAHAGADLPHTGADLPGELVLAIALLGAGGVLRLRSTANRP